MKYKKGNTLILILACFMILIFITVASAFFLQLQKSKNVDPPAQTKIPAHTEIPAETKDWKTYENKQFGFVVKHPTSVKPEEINQTAVDQKIESGHQRALISFGNVSSNGFDIEVTTGDAIDYYKYQISEQGAQKIISDEKIQAVGSEWTKIVYLLPFGASRISLSKVITHANGFDYIITAPSQNIDQILSTFKFTNQTIPDNQEFNSYGVEFTYPNDFSVQPVSNSKLINTSLNPGIGFGVLKMSHTKTGRFNLESMFIVTRAEFVPKNKNDLTTGASCFASDNSDISFTKNITIGETQFLESRLIGGAAAGNQYSEQSFRTVRGDYCWDITLTNHSSSDWNGVNQNEAKMLQDANWQELSQILHTFKFTNPN